MGAPRGKTKKGTAAPAARLETVGAAVVEKVGDRGDRDYSA